MKISVLSNQNIIQVFRIINMLLSCIYTFVYLGSIASLRGVIIDNMVKREQQPLCLLLRWTGGIAIFSPASLYYHLVITILLIF